MIILEHVGLTFSLLVGEKFNGSLFEFLEGIFRAVATVQGLCLLTAGFIYNS